MTAENEKRALVFAGTTEGGAITAFLSNAGVRVHACVATQYGRTSIPKCDAEISSSPLADEEMKDLMKEFPFVVDATHPYATSITAHIRRACAETGTEYLRIDRPSSAVVGDDIVVVPDVEAAVEYLKNTDGNILVTTGSKEVERFTAIPDYQSRVFVRVLSIGDSVNKCIEAGFVGRNLFAMQGPFCAELDYGMMVQTGARFMVTKDSGTSGGFSEKLVACKKAKATMILVSRPDDKGGIPYDEALKVLCRRFSIPVAKDRSAAFNGMERRRMILVGTGVGDGTGLTEAASKAVMNADLVVGAERMLRIPEASGKPQLKE